MKKLICYFIGHRLKPIWLPPNARIWGNTFGPKEGGKGQYCDRCRTIFLSAPMPPQE